MSERAKEGKDHYQDLKRDLKAKSLQDHPIVKRTCGMCDGLGVIQINAYEKVPCGICNGRGFRNVR